MASTATLTDSESVKPLGELNKADTADGGSADGVHAVSGHDMMFSHTTVSSGEIQMCDPDQTLAPVVPYQDFAVSYPSLLLLSL